MLILFGVIVVFLLVCAFSGKHSYKPYRVNYGVDTTYIFKNVYDEDEI